MYDSTYQTHKSISKQLAMYQLIQKVLLILLLVLATCIGSIFIYDKYKPSNVKHLINVQSKKTEATAIMSEEESLRVQLKRALTQSIVKNIKAQKAFKTFNDDEIKYIITNVVQKIETAPKEIIYTQQ